jgi:hypothetical protein
MTDAFTKYVELVELLNKESQRPSWTSGFVPFGSMLILLLTKVPSSVPNRPMNFFSVFAHHISPCHRTTCNVAAKLKWQIKPLPNTLPPFLKILP